MFKTKFYWDPETIKYFRDLREKDEKQFEKDLHIFINTDCDIDNGEEVVTTYQELKEDLRKALD